MPGETFAVSTEEELYAEIARAWCRMQAPGKHVERPLQPYALGPDFAHAVWSEPEDNAQRIIVVCAKVISLHHTGLCGARRVDGVTRMPGEALDPVSSWWRPLDELGELGLHYWVLANKTIELRSLAAFDSPPPAQYGRFAVVGGRS